jgi:hypothetical protein
MFKDTVSINNARYVLDCLPFTLKLHPCLVGNLYIFLSLVDTLTQGGMLTTPSLTRVFQSRNVYSPDLNTLNSIYLVCRPVKDRRSRLMKANCGNSSLELDFVNIRGVCFISFKLKGKKNCGFFLSSFSRSFCPFTYFILLRKYLVRTVLPILRGLAGFVDSQCHVHRVKILRYSTYISQFSVTLHPKRPPSSSSYISWYSHRARWS